LIGVTGEVLLKLGGLLFNMREPFGASFGASDMGGDETPGCAVSE